LIPKLLSGLPERPGAWAARRRVQQGTGCQPRLLRQRRQGYRTPRVFHGQGRLRQNEKPPAGHCRRFRRFRRFSIK